MSDENNELKALLEEFLSTVKATLASHEKALQRHEACLAEQLSALKRHEENRKIDHENIRQVTEQTNHHMAILGKLDAAVQERLGYSTEPPPEPVN